ncbi:hypothetical protein IAU60_002472 [Kwoniella sp. DSM 27419]
MKSEEEVVNDFNEIVNMTAEELDTFLKTEGSETTGFKKDDGSGESIGHESGRKIVDILQRNPDKDPSKYTEEDKEHMRRVVSYCKRHLAQEGKLKETKTPEELEQTKSTRSLKNWGHDPMKTLDKSEQPSKPASKGKPASKKEAPKSAGKPKSKGKAEPAKDTKAEDKGEQADKADKAEESTDKPKSKGKPASKKAAAAAKDEDKELGDKREADKAPEKSEKPPSKKAKTTKEPTEATRKPPSRSAKKA